VSHHFFLSYSRADRSPLVKRFFEDLCDTIRIESNLRRTESVGFYEEIRYSVTSEWSAAAKEALQDSGMMVCLLSPAYLHCERAGKEWQLFEMRRQVTFAGPDPLDILPESLAHIILPVTWSPWDGPLPKVIREILAHPDHIHQQQALLTMFKSAGMSHREYAEYVRNLANQIIELTPAASRLRPLDPLPAMSEVHSAFGLWDEAAMGSNKGGNQSKQGENTYQFVKGAQLNERTVTNSETGEASSSNKQKEPQQVLRKKTRTNFLVSAISNESQVLELIEELCLLSDFHVKKYKDAEEALTDVRSNPGRVSDLFIIDLDDATPGQQVFQTLNKWKLPSTILAVSGNFERYTLPELFGAMAIVPSLFRSEELMDLIEQCAKIGRGRRIYRKEKVRDQARTKRPVFLSYSSKDRELAKFLSSNLAARTIEAWTMDESQDLGDQWRTEIRNGIKEAQAFVALITNNYLKSDYCVDELKRFYESLTSEPVDEQQRLLIPVFYENPNISGNDFFEREVKGYTAAMMSEKDFLNGFTLLMGRIQSLLRNYDNDL